MKAFGLLLVTLILTGCVTAQEHYESYLESFIGKSRKTLISEWGAPDRSFNVEDDGSEIILVYIEDNGANGVAFGNMVHVERRVCKTEFTILKGKVRDWNYVGYCP